MNATIIDWTSSFPIKEDNTAYKCEEFKKTTFTQRVTFALSSASLFAYSTLNGGIAHANTSVNEVIPSTFEPVKDLILSLAEPLCWIMFAWGCIEVICKRPTSGLDRMKYAAIGFIGIQLIPVMMNVIKTAAPQ